MNESLECQYCNRAYTRWGDVDRHEEVCPHNPVVAERVRRVLHASADGPLMPTMRTYKAALQDEEGLPWVVDLCKNLGLDWDGVARWAGLRPRSEQAQYCIEELQRLAQELHGGRYGPSATDWIVHAGPATYTHVQMLKIFDARSWDAVLAVAGLSSADRGYYFRAAKARREQLEIAAEAEIEALQQAAKVMDKDYPVLPGKWKVKTYALWPSGQQITGMVYELR